MWPKIKQNSIRLIKTTIERVRDEKYPNLTTEPLHFRLNLITAQ